MRPQYKLFTAILLAASAWALPTFPTTYYDVLDSTNPGDVIGDPNKFEIYSLKFAGYDASTNKLQVDIRFNFGGGTALNGFTISNPSPVLNVGDLFFRTANNTYATILRGHNGLTTNGFYRIEDTQTAQEVLGNPSGFIYRNNAEVWASASGAQLLGTGSKTVTTVNGKNTHLLASIFIALDATSKADLDSGFSFYFASATCGNDEITGHVAGVPEPGTWALLGAGLFGIGLLRRKRR